MKEKGKKFRVICDIFYFEEYKSSVNLPLIFVKFWYLIGGGPSIEISSLNHRFSLVTNI